MTIESAYYSILLNLASGKPCSTCEAYFSELGMEFKPQQEKVWGFVTMYQQLDMVAINVATLETKQPEIALRLRSGDLNDLNNGYSVPGKPAMWLLKETLTYAPMCSIEHTIVHELAHTMGLRDEARAYLEVPGACGFFKPDCYYVPLGIGPWHE